VFPIGATAVTCTVTDQRQRTDSCSFDVTVAAPPVLRLTKFVAFGDSMTNGEIVSEGSVPGFHPLLVDRAKAYPADLQTGLRSRYTTQTAAITVENQGVSGETAAQGASRLSGVLSRGGYDVLLLLDGANDITTRDSQSVGPAVRAVQTMVRDAKSRGLLVFVATLPPQDPQGSRGTGAILVAPFNDALKSMAASEGVPVVDVYDAFGANVADLIDVDGLHPTAAGYQKIADTFLASIRSTLEIAPSVASVARARRHR
jgi:lysophospholipase L1-like esterase